MNNSENQTSCAESEWETDSAQSRLFPLWTQDGRLSYLGRPLSTIDSTLWKLLNEEPIYTPNRFEGEAAIQKLQAYFRQNRVIPWNEGEEKTWDMWNRQQLSDYWPHSLRRFAITTHIGIWLSLNVRDLQESDRTVAVLDILDGYYHPDFLTLSTRAKRQQGRDFQKWLSAFSEQFSTNR